MAVAEEQAKRRDRILTMRGEDGGASDSPVTAIIQPPSVAQDDSQGFCGLPDAKMTYASKQTGIQAILESLPGVTA